MRSSAAARVAQLPVPRAPLVPYALLAAPLMMTALPLAIVLPGFYNSRTGLALGTVGAVLLLTRLIDAVVDPLLGSWVDQQRERGHLLAPLLRGSVILAIAFSALMLPPPGLAGGWAIVWLAVSLVAAYLGFSLAVIAYQAWGAGLAHDDAGRARVTAMREGVGLLGVLVGGSLPAWAGHGALVAVFLVTFAGATWLLVQRAQRPDRVVPPLDRVATLRTLQRQAARNRTALNVSATTDDSPWRAFVVPLRHMRSRWLLAVFGCNAIAPAITATLLPFYVADQLQLTAQLPWFLALYFLAGAASMPLWSRLARRISLHALWLMGMVASVAAFAWAWGLGAGQGTAFGVICVLSGLAFGADLALPPALLARVIDANGHSGQREGAYFGLWNFVNKLCLALAAGVALPLLELIGYEQQRRDPTALAALAFTYAVVPSVLKLAAAALLAQAWLRGRF